MEVTRYSMLEEAHVSLVLSLDMIAGLVEDQCPSVWMSSTGNQVRLQNILGISLKPWCLAVLCKRYCQH